MASGAELPTEQPKLITEVPAELGGEQIRADVEVDQLAREADKDKNPVIGVHTNIHGKMPPTVEAPQQPQ